MMGWLRSAVALTAVLSSGVVTGCSPGTPSAGADAAHAVSAPPQPATVTALGRIEPKNRIRRIAGPSRPSVVIATLYVEEGDRIREGQPIATLDTLAEDRSRVARAKAQVNHAQRALDRMLALSNKGIIATSELEDAQLAVAVANAELTGAEAALALDTVEAPATGQVIAVHARRGERVGPDGIAELAQNDEMYAIAEVYETDIARVQVGQHATVHSPALPEDLGGTVERIARKIGKLDVLDTDPVARTDARVVEVHVRLDDTQRAAGLSNLQVEVTIDTQVTAAAPSGDPPRLQDVRR